MNKLVCKAFRRWSKDNPPAGKIHCQQDAVLFYLSLDHDAQQGDWPVVLNSLLEAGLVR